MKLTVLSFCFGFVFFLVFMVGVGFGVSVRLPPSRVVVSSPARPDQDELKCTCVPCLPDHFCRKCGHKSRDCPKLRWYFHSRTNSLNKAVKQ